MSTEADALLLDGELVVEGRLVDASNATLYAKVSDGADEITVIYKPVRGERPLWDFPDGTLAQREFATYLIDRALGWDLVPTDDTARRAVRSRHGADLGRRRRDR